MSTYCYSPALDRELEYRRDGLRRDAAEHRQARRAAGTARHSGHRSAH
jgi:hypothetical protein